MLSGFDDAPSLFDDEEINPFERQDFSIQEVDESPKKPEPSSTEEINLRSLESSVHFDLENTVSENNQNIFNEELTEEEAIQLKTEENRKNSIENTQTTSKTITKDISFAGSVYNLLTSTTPVGLLFVPFLFKSCGLLGGFMFLFISAVFSMFSLKFLHSVHQVVPSAKNYDELGMIGIQNKIFSHILGIGLKSILIFYNVTYMTFSVSIVFEFGVKLIQEFSGSNVVLSKWIIVFFTFIPLFLLSFSKSLNEFRWFSLISFWFILNLTIFLFLGYLTNNTNAFGEIKVFNVELSFLEGFGISIFIFTNQFNFVSIQSEQKEKETKRDSIFIILTIVTKFFIYLIIGIFGYLSFADNTKINFFDSFYYDSKLWLNYTMRGIHSLLLVLTFPHLIFSSKRALENLLAPLKRYFTNQENERIIFFQHKILNFIHEKIWLISLDIQNILITFILVGLAVTSGASNIRADEFLVLFFLIPLATMISLVFPPLMFFLITKYQ
eukprot:gene11526-4779_t